MKTMKKKIIIIIIIYYFFFYNIFILLSQYLNIYNSFKEDIDVIIEM